MQFLIVVALCTLAACVVVCGANSSIQSTFTECSQEFGVTKEELLNIHKDMAAAMPGDDVKCFYRCMLTKTGLVDGDKLNMEKVMGLVMEDVNNDEATVKKRLDVCKDRLQGAGTCDEFWELVKCYFTQD